MALAMCRADERVPRVPLITGWDWGAFLAAGTTWAAWTVLGFVALATISSRVAEGMRIAVSSRVAEGMWGTFLGFVAEGMLGTAWAVSRRVAEGMWGTFLGFVAWDMQSIAR